MARPREFDEAQALERAMEVFWEKGYRNTSLDDLLNAMGIQRGSFYNTFGSKKLTYIRTIEHYVDFMTEGGPYAELAQNKPGLAALRSTFQGYLDSVTGKGPFRGCFIAHAAKEGRGNDPDIQRAVVAGIDKMRRLLARSIAAAQTAGDLPADVPPEGLATVFMSAAWGLHVLAEAGVPKETLERAGAQLFELTTALV